MSSRIKRTWEEKDLSDVPLLVQKIRTLLHRKSLYQKNYALELSRIPLGSQER